MAAQNGHDKVVEALLKYDKIAPNQSNKAGNTPLLIAAENGHIKVVEALLKYDKIAPNQSNKAGVNPLWMAAQNGHDKIVEALLKHDKIDLNQFTKAGASPLWMAAQEGHVKVVEALLKHDKIDPNQSNKAGSTPLLIAAQKGYDKIVEALLKHKGDNQTIKDGTNPLIMGLHIGRGTLIESVIEAGYYKVLETLLKHNVIDPNLTTKKNGLTFLILAARTGNTETVRVLLDHGADLNQSKLDGVTPLLMAVDKGHVSVVEILLKYKDIDPNKAKLNGLTPLLMAVDKGHISVVEALLKHKDIDPNKPNNDGITPLLRAAAKGHVAVVEALLKGAADPNYKETQTLLTIETFWKFPRIVQLLKNYGARGTNMSEKIILFLSHIHKYYIAYASSFMGISFISLMLYKHQSKRRQDELESKLYAAIKDANLTDLPLLLDQYPDLRKLTPDGNTLFWYALKNIENAHLTCKLFLDKDPSLAGESADNITPLCYAIKQKATACVEMLLNHVDANQATSDHSSPLFNALKLENSVPFSLDPKTSIVNLLLEKGAQTNIYTLEAAKDSDFFDSLLFSKNLAKNVKTSVINELANKCSILEENITKYESKLKKFETLIKKTEQNILENNAALTNARHSNSRIKGLISNLEKAIENFKKHLSTYQTNKVRFIKLLKEKKGELTKVKTRLEQLTNSGSPTSNPKEMDLSQGAALLKSTRGQTNTSLSAIGSESESAMDTQFKVVTKPKRAQQIAGGAIHHSNSKQKQVLSQTLSHILDNYLSFSFSDIKETCPLKKNCQNMLAKTKLINTIVSQCLEKEISLKEVIEQFYEQEGTHTKDKAREIFCISVPKNTLEGEINRIVWTFSLFDETVEELLNFLATKVSVVEPEKSVTDKTLLAHATTMDLLLSAPPRIGTKSNPLFKSSDDPPSLAALRTAIIDSQYANGLYSPYRLITVQLSRGRPITIIFVMRPDDLKENLGIDLDSLMMKFQKAVLVSQSQTDSGFKALTAEQKGDYEFKVYEGKKAVRVYYKKDPELTNVFISTAIRIKTS